MFLYMFTNVPEYSLRAEKFPLKSSVSIIHVIHWTMSDSPQIFLKGRLHSFPSSNLKLTQDGNRE
jgi:hypothetical protein